MKNLKILFCLFFLLSIGSTNVWGYISGTTTVTVSGTTITVSPTDGISGAMKDYSSSSDINSLWGTSIRSATTLIIEEGVTHIGAYSFYGFSNITSVTIPTSVTSIGTYAFYNCSAMATIYYAGTPNGWASISFAARTSNPFYSKNGGSFCFNGSKNTTSYLAFAQGLERINDHAFYNASFSTINIPGSVQYIGAYALYCSPGTIVINNATPPSLGSSTSISYKATTGKLYVRKGTQTTYNSASTWNSAPDGIEEFEVTGTSLDTYGSNIKWTFADNGTLTLDASAVGASKIISYDSYLQYKWTNARRLVNKVILKGEITELTKTFTYCFGLNEIELDQSTIPTITTDGDKIAFNSRFDQSKNVVLKIKPASLTNASASRLGSAPWNNAKLDIQLSDDLVIDQASGDNLTILTNCSTYVEKPVNVQLTRSTLSTEMYNTFCSPVSMTEEEIVETFGDWYDEGTGIGTELVEYTGTSEEDDAISLNFSSATSIEAGKPYLFRPANDVPNIRFTNVGPSSLATGGQTVEGGYADFIGTLAPVDASDYAEDKNFIFLLANNKLTYATGGTLKGMRAYFLLEKGTPASVMAKRPVLQIGNGENTTTDLGQVPSDKIQCTKVLRDGQIYILRGEKAYNLQGIEIDRPNKL